MKNNIGFPQGIGLGIITEINGAISWPTLDGRLSQPIVTELEALEQLEKCMPLSEEGTKRLKKLIDEQK